MAVEDPVKWGKSKLRKLAEMGDEWAEWTTKARDVSLPGVPLAALAGFCFNGDAWCTTGWKTCSPEERAEAIAKGKRPFKKGVRGDYGGVDREGDLHEVGWWGTEAAKTPNLVAVGSCPWVSLADDADVVKVLGRKAVTGGDWYEAMADQCAIGVANLRRHWRNAREDLHPSLRWDKDDKRAVPWRYFLAMAHWSAGGRACDHVNAYADDLAPLPESQRWGAFMRFAAEHDDAGSRHRQDEYTAWKTACKIEGGVAAAPSLGEPWAEEWLRSDGLATAERARIYTRLCEVSTVSGQ